MQGLIGEIDEARGASSKDIQRFLARKDGLIGGGTHHAKRSVTLGQSRGNLQKWLDKH